MATHAGGPKLLVNASATGAWMQWPGGRGLFSAEATFGGGTVSLQFMGPNGAAITAGVDTTLTAAGGGIFDLPPCQIRATVATATAVYATASQLGL